MGLAVSDYAFLQDAIYAGIWLSGPELAAYEQLARQVAGLVDPPSALIHLDAPVELLLQRIARRGRAYEVTFTSEFLQRLAERYRAAMEVAACPVLHVDVARRDLSDPQQRQALLADMRGMMGQAYGDMPDD